MRQSVRETDIRTVVQVDVAPAARYAHLHRVSYGFVLVCPSGFSRLLKSPGILCKISRTRKVLENVFGTGNLLEGPGKSWKNSTVSSVLVYTGHHM